VTQFHPAKIPRVPRNARVRGVSFSVSACRRVRADQGKRGRGDTGRHEVTWGGTAGWT
jgi:hypothetical protein